MDFQTLARRELQALCKLNKIPANITNVAMIDALSSLDIVVGIEDLLNPSETSESSVETPAKTAAMTPRVPRTGYRTTTRQKPVREEAEAVTTVTRTTRRGVRKIAGEVEDSKTAAVPVTPAAVSTRRRAPAASVRKNMETQLKESKEDVLVEESMDQEKKPVPATPAAAVPSSRRKVPAASTTRGTNLKEESMFGRTYSTRRSARLAEVKVAEPTPVEKESKKLEKIDSVSTQTFEEMLDEGSDDLNAVAEDSSLSVNALAVASESKSKLMEMEKEKTSSADTDMGTGDTIAVDAKNDVLESMGSNNMEVDVIQSDIQKPSEDSKCETVEELSSNEDMDSVDVAVAEMENEVLDNKVGDVYLSATENSSETLKDEPDKETCGESDTDNSSETLEDESGEESCEESDRENSSEENVENVFTSEDMDSDEKTAALVESVILENNVENLNELEEISFSLAEEEPLVDDVTSEDLEKIESAELKSSESDVESQNLEKSDSAAQDEFQDDFEFPQLVSHESVDESVVMDIAADFSSFSLTSIPTSDVDAVPTQVPSSKTTTPLKKSAAKKTPTRKMALVSDDKENIDQSGTNKLQQLIKDVGMTTIKKDNDQSKVLFEEKSLRQLTKMLKEKLQISNNVNTTNAEEKTNTTNNKVQQTTTRPALQALSSNSLASTGIRN